MSLSAIAEKIKKARAYPRIEDVTLTNGGLAEFPELKDAARRIARSFSLKPFMHSPLLDENGECIMDAGLLAGVSFEDIDDLIDDDVLFNLEHVRSKSIAEGIKKDLSGGNEQWAMNRFIDEGMADVNSAVLRSTDDDGKTNGILVCERDLCIDVYDDGIVLSYTIDPKFVYVSPDARGNHISTALRRLLIDGVRQDIEKISSVWDSGKIQAIYPSKIQFRLSADVHSDGGERFADSLTENFALEIEDHFSSEQRKSDFYDEDTVYADICV